MNGAPSPAVSVLMTADPIGGVWTYSLHLVRALRERGVSVTLAIMGGEPSAAQRDELDVAWYCHPGRLEWMDDCWHDVEQAGNWLLELEQTVRPDLVHLNGYVHASLDWSVPVMVAAHSCVLSWWSAVHQEAPPRQWNEYREKVRQGVKAAATLVAPSCAMLSAIDLHYGAIPDNSRVIHNGLDLQEDTGEPKDSVIFAAGRVWDQAKNLSLLDNIAASVFFPIEIAGDCGEQKASCDIRYLGLLPHAQIQARMRRAAIFASPALYEPFGLAVLEAARGGCALVLSDIPSFREIWGDSAIFVSPRSPGCWIRELNRLCANPAALKHFGAKARKRSRQYTSQVMADSYVAVYRELVV